MYRALISCFFCCLLLHAGAQPVDSLGLKLENVPDSSLLVFEETETVRYDRESRIGAVDYFTLLGSDLKQQVTTPFHMQRKDWKRLGLFTASMGVLSLADRPLQRQAVRWRNSSGTVCRVSNFITDFGGDYELYTLGAMAAYGIIFKNEKMRTTTLLATQAYITSTVMSGLLKSVSGRRRPSYYEASGVQAKPVFQGPMYKGTNGNDPGFQSSFPSGHTTLAFAAASVYAHQYRDHKWVPVVAYGAATMIGLSRITENRHWLTDVVAGAALGILTGRQVVNNYHRSLKHKKPGLRSRTSITIQYQQGRVQPGVVVRM